MSIVEDRALGNRELLFAVEADVEDASRNRLRLKLAGFGILAGSGTGLFDVLGNLGALAGDAANAIRPAHFL